MTSAAIRAYGVTMAAIGIGTVARAAAIATATPPDGQHGPDPRIVRVLGARQLAQGLLAIAVPTERAVLGGVVTDASHALSMVALAGAVRRLRRPALASGLVATASASYGLVVVRHGPSAALKGR